MTSASRVVGLLVLIAGISGCRAETQAHAACMNLPGPGDAIVAACTRAIDEAGKGDDGDRAILFLHRGLARQGMGQASDALADLDQAVALAPRDAMILANRGAVKGEQGRFDDALRDLEATLAMDPRNTLALGNRAIVREKQGHYPEARADIDAALAIDDQPFQLWAERCWIGAVLADELPRTLQECDRAIARNSDDPNNYNSRGFAHFKSGHYDLAIADYDRAIEADPNVASSYLVRGLARRAKGDRALGDAEIAHALELEPGVAARYAGYGIRIDAAGSAR
jgi:tetratricopeptide (TPR) repeat protein